MSEHEDAIARLSEALIAPLREVAETLAKELDKLREHVDDLEAKLIEKGVL